MIRALNQENLNQTGKDLSKFLPKCKCSLSADGELRLEPSAVKGRPVLKDIGDHEQAAQKAWLLLSLKIRSCFRPDDLHSMRNDTRCLLLKLSSCVGVPLVRAATSAVKEKTFTSHATGNALVRHS